MMIICPFGTRIKRASPDRYPPTVFVESTPESITPLERLAPYLLLISFSFIRFMRCIIHSISEKVKSFVEKTFLPPVLNFLNLLKRLLFFDIMFTASDRSKLFILSGAVGYFYLNLPEAVCIQERI